MTEFHTSSHRRAGCVWPVTVNREENACDYPTNPIKSGFGPKTTADEVLAGLDLSGSQAIVTGGHSGLGLETTLALAGAGARVIVACRAPAAAKEVLGQSAGVEIAELDLADLNSVRRFAADFSASSLRADIVINNAGVMACLEARVGQGWERQFATNHLGHYALTNLLWPAIADGGRVVTVSSAGHHHSAIRWEDVQFERGYDKWLAYGQSKTANALFAVRLDLLGRSRGSAHLAFTLAVSPRCSGTYREQR